MRIDSRESIQASWGGAVDASELPVRKGAPNTARVPQAKSSDAVDTAASTSQRAWWHSAIRFVRDAVIGVALLTSVPLAVIGVRGANVTPSLASITDMRERLDDAARLRALKAPIDASVTPLDAGIALHRVHAHRSPIVNEMFPTRDVPPRVERPWENRPKAIGMFPPSSYQGTDAMVASQLLQYAPGSFDPEMMAYLERVAAAPVWRDVDVVASAERVDVIGGAFTLPFRDDAFADAIPIPRFADTKALAYAGISRAAYYVATGHPDRAEAALKSIVSFGFAFIDNGTTAIDAMIGRVIVDIGRDGLHQFYGTTGDARGLALAEPLPKIATRLQSARALPRSPRERDPQFVRTELIALIQDPTMPRALRYNALHALAASGCGNVREVLFGADADVRAAIGDARSSMARFSSEQAFVDLLAQTTSRVPPSQLRTGWSDVLLLGAATTASTVLHNPRIASCALMVRGVDRNRE